METSIFSNSKLILDVLRKLERRMKVSEMSTEPTARQMASKNSWKLVVRGDSLPCALEIFDAREL